MSVVDSVVENGIGRASMDVRVLAEQTNSLAIKHVTCNVFVVLSH